jgi:chemotaxis signal transduction protein
MQINSFENWMGILVFEISSIEFGCNITRVHVIHSVKQKLTSEGRITYNGKEIPFYYMGDLLKIKSVSKNKNEHILIFESDEGPFGFGIDELEEVLPWNKKIFENEVKTEKTADDKFFLGKIYFEGRTILLPDFDRIINNIRNKRYVSLQPSPIVQY